MILGDHGQMMFQAEHKLRRKGQIQRFLVRKNRVITTQNT